jgi:hypothetical protein
VSCRPVVSLAQVTDEASANARIAMMEEQEMKEWKVREQDIERLQKERLELLEKLLQQRDESQKLGLEYDAVEIAVCLLMMC